MCAATLTSIHTCCALSPCVRVCDGHTHTHTHSGPASYKTYKVALYQQCVQFMVWFLLAAAQTLLPSLPVSVSHSSPLLLPLSRSLSLSPAAFLSLPLSSPVFFYYFLLLAADALRQSAVNPSSTHNPYTTPLPLPEPPPSLLYVHLLAATWQRRLRLFVTCIERPKKIREQRFHRN